jgi:inorganic pyrophosphatase
VKVIIETPKGSRNKFKYDPALRMFKLSKVLPEGMVFPYDFGFVPSTKGDDGDPVDVLVLMDEPTFPGCLLECRLVGVLEAGQEEKKKKNKTLGLWPWQSNLCSHQRLLVSATLIPRFSGKSRRFL